MQISGHNAFLEPDFLSIPHINIIFRNSLLLFENVTFMMYSSTLKAHSQHANANVVNLKRIISISSTIKRKSRSLSLTVPNKQKCAIYILKQQRDDLLTTAEGTIHQNFIKQNMKFLSLSLLLKPAVNFNSRLCCYRHSGCN